MMNTHPLPFRFYFLQLFLLTVLLAFSQAASAQTLALVKQVINDEGGAAAATEWILKADGPTLLSGLGGVSATAVDPGIYILSESDGPPGYAPSAWSCTAGVLTLDRLSLGAGEDAVCTITNNDGAVPATYTVCPSGPPGCDYVSPAEAINNPARVPGDVIDIQTGTYVLGERLDIGIDMTIEGNGSVFDATGDRAMVVYGVNTTVTLNNLTIRNGQPFQGIDGGALLVTTGAFVTINDSIFEDNQASAGGAIHNAGGTIFVNGSRFLGNQATGGEGGAIWTTDNGETTLRYVQVDGNKASNAGGGLAVANLGSTLGVISSTVSNNMALTVVPTVSNPPSGFQAVQCGYGYMGQTFTADASALSAFEFYVTVISAPDDILITGHVREGGPSGAVVATSTINVAGGEWPAGSDQTLTFNLDPVLPVTPGAVYAIETKIEADYLIKLTETDYLDGAAYECSTQLNSRDFAFRTFGGDFGDGSGIYVGDSADVWIGNSTVSSNLGDGVTVDSNGSARSMFSTIFNNSGNGFNADIGTTANLISTIIAGNGGNDCEGDFTSEGYNLIGDDGGVCSLVIIPGPPGDLIGTSASPIDPMLGPLQDNLGFTLTHAPEPGSPVINAGATTPPEGCDPISPGRDQRGITRPTGWTCDIGSVEWVPIQTLVDFASPGVVVNIPDGVYNELITIGDDKTLRGVNPANVVINGDTLGGSVITAEGNFTLEGISITNGSSPDHGGGMVVIGSDKEVYLHNVVFENNDATSTGGAIYIDGGNVYGQNVDFTNNHALAGGAIYNSAGVATFVDSAFFINQATTSYGGAIMTGNAGRTQLTRTEVDGNYAELSGGGLLVASEFSQLDLLRVTVSNNEVGNNNVGGISASGLAVVNITDSTVSGNQGAGILVSDSSLQVVNSTIANNARGIQVFGSPAPLIRRSIIAANNTYDCYGTLVSGGYNLIGNTGGCGFTPSTGDLVGQLSDTIDPLLGPLQDNGGFTYTHALATNSPAVNGGGPASELDCPGFDQRGVPRPTGDFCDIGAYEAPEGPMVLGSSATLLGGSVYQGLPATQSHPGVVDVPIIDIPIEKLTKGAQDTPESAPLGSFPLGSFPIGSFDLQNSPLGSFPLGSFPIGSFPIGSFPIGSFPIGSFPLSSIPLLREGGWTAVLNDIPELAGAPIQSVTLEQLLTSSSFPDCVEGITLRDLSIQGSPLGSFSLPGLALGATTVAELDQWAGVSAGDPGAVCATLADRDQPFTDCGADDTLLSLEFKGAPVSALSLSSLPLGSFPTESTPLGSFPIGSFPLGSFPLGSFPLGSFPLGSFPMGSFPLGSFPIGSFPIGSFALNSFKIHGQSFCQFYDDHASATGGKTCLQLGVNEGTDSLKDLVEKLQLVAQAANDPTSGISHTPLGSFPLGSFPLGSFPIGSFPLGSFPIGSFPIGSFPLGSFPIGSFLLNSFPIGSFPVGSFPLGSFDIDGMSFCDFYDQQAAAVSAKTCDQLLNSPSTATLADLVAALQSEFQSDETSTIGSTPLGSFPIGSFPIGSFPIGSFPLGSFDLDAPPLSDIRLGYFGGCALIEENSTDSCETLDLDLDSTLRDVADAYGGSLADSPLGSFPLGSFGISDMPMGSFPIGSFKINGTPLGSFPLGSFDLVHSPLGSFPIGSFPLGSFPPEIVTDPDGLCSACRTLADAARAGVINSDAKLEDLKASSAFADVTLGEVFDAMTLATLYGDKALADIEDTGDLTLGQLLIAMMLKTDFPWETIPLEKLQAQEYSPDNYIFYGVDFELSGTGSEEVVVSTTVPDDTLYKKGSGHLYSSFVKYDYGPFVTVPDPEVVNNGDGTQTLSFKLNLTGYRQTYHWLPFQVVAPLALGTHDALASVQLNGASVAADNTYAQITVIPDPRTDPGTEIPVEVPKDVLLLGYIDTPDDNDFFEVEPPAAGNRVAVFMANPASDYDLIMYEPLTTVERKGQAVTAAPLDSVPFEDDGVNYERNFTEEPNALEDENLQSTTLASISTNREGADESVSAIAGNTDPFTIQVSGYNGAISDDPYILRVKVTPEVSFPTCTPRSWPSTGASSSVVPAGSWETDTNAVFLVNGARLAASEGYDSAAADAADAALAAINNLIHAAGVTNGVVVDVSDISSEMNVLYEHWDANPCDVDAANDIVNAITGYLEDQRSTSPDLAYVTIVGSDEVIPFARKPDETSKANESTYAGEFSDNALYGALVTRHFLSDDTYGDIDPIAWLDRYLNVPELAVGRLVETADDIRIAAENYVAFAGILDPGTALSAGYDFVADAAEDIDETFNDYGPALGFSVEEPLIDQPDVLPEEAWTRLEFLAAVGLTAPANPVDLVSFNMHFDFDEALPSSGYAYGDVKSNLITTMDLANTDLAGGIWFTVGCHSGTNVPDVSVIGDAPSEDWAQSFSRLGALYLAQNAYGLGDDVALALSERLMTLFARNLDGSMTIGEAHAYAKQQYFADLGLYGEYDFKALQAATLFGLPMYKYGFGQAAADTLPPALTVSTDPVSGLSSASWSLIDTGIAETTTNKGKLFSVDGEVQFVHFRPLQPIVRKDVTGPGGEIASGAFLTRLVTEDLQIDDIAFAQPVVDRGDIEPEVESDVISFPAAFTNIANFMAPPPTGGPFAPRQQLNVIVGQFTSLPDGFSNGIERLFRSFEAQVFYRPVPAADDFIRPEFDNVQAGVTESAGARQAAFSVDVFDEGDVLRVAVLYLKSIGTDGKSIWELANLVKGASNGAGGYTWTGGGPVELADGKVDYMVQAVDSNGNVANSTFKGRFYVAKTYPSAPTSGETGTIGVTLSANGSIVIDPSKWIIGDPVSAEVTNRSEGVSYKYSVDSGESVLPEDGKFDITGNGVHAVTIKGSDGSDPVSFFVMIDTTPPQAMIARPVNNEFVIQDQEPVARYDCLDANSGIASCNGSAANGAPVPSTNTGSQHFTVTAQDIAGLDPVVVEHSYYVVQPIDITGPVDPVAIGNYVNISISATDLEAFAESVTIEWADGTISTSMSSPPFAVTQNGELFMADHLYAGTGVYPITVTVAYGEGEHIQTGVFEFAVVYNPKGGFVTGGGWFNSPPGAYTPGDSTDPDVVGRANFGLVSKYEKGQSVPDGSTNFRFAAGDLVFDATDYEWMIITGANVRYKGEGTVNGGAGLYKFMVTALDADILGSGVTQDGFRIKIWQEDPNGVEAVLYDNGLGVDETTGTGGTTPLGGGSITIHKDTKK